MKSTVYMYLTSVTVIFIVLIGARTSTLDVSMKSIISSAISILPTAFSSPCQVYPLECAYCDDSVSRIEMAGANCRASDMEKILHTAEYIYCDGTQLTLVDSDTGSEQYSSRDYYVWSAGRDWQLLFIFPTRVSLTTITLHYYSDSIHGRPK